MSHKLVLERWISWASTLKLRSDRYASQKLRHVSLALEFVGTVSYMRALTLELHYDCYLSQKYALASLTLVFYATCLKNAVNSARIFKSTEKLERERHKCILLREYISQKDEIMHFENLRDPRTR